jgi:threonine dehydratase
LARVTAIVASAGGNIEEVHHQRAFSLLAAQCVEVQLVIQARNHDHTAAIVKQLRDSGFDALELKI